MQQQRAADVHEPLGLLKYLQAAFGLTAYEDAIAAASASISTKRAQGQAIGLKIDRWGVPVWCAECPAPRITVVCQRPCHCFHASCCPLCLVCAAGSSVAEPTMLTVILRLISLDVAGMM